MRNIQKLVAERSRSHWMKYMEIEPAYRQEGVVEIEVAGGQ